MKYQMVISGQLARRILHQAYWGCIIQRRDVKEEEEGKEREVMADFKK